MQEEFSEDPAMYDASVDSIIKGFFGNAPHTVHRREQRRFLQEQQLTGTVMSSSFAPSRNHSRYHHWCEAIAALYSRHAGASGVVVEYDSIIALGRSDNGSTSWKA
jgi:hypothetical protein